ncbi:MAG TPA: PIN domain-containing protein [Micromonosporaceae bacterium]
MVGAIGQADAVDRPLHRFGDVRGWHLLSGELDLLDFDDEDARVAGQVRAALEIRGTPIGAYDLLIAGQALRRGLTVITANGAEFGRVSGLNWEDWSI